MIVQLQYAGTNSTEEANISKTSKQELPLKKHGWQFNWRQMSRKKGALLFKLTQVASPNVIEAMLMLTILNGEMVYMNAIELAPHNYGSNGTFSNAAGIMLGYACLKSFQLGKGHYRGYVSFDSKTKLIQLYETKYGAIRAMGQKMFFDDYAGQALIKRYLKLDNDDRYKS